MAIFQRGPTNWGKIAIFDQYLALGSMTSVVSSVVHRGVKFITADSDNETPHVSESCL